MSVELLENQDNFSQALYEKMQQVSPSINLLALFEFRYALENVIPPGGWQSVDLLSKEQIENLVNDSRFYSSIQLKPRQEGRLVLDSKILHLLRMLLVGLVMDVYPVQWVCAHFYFDVRGFYFLHRTRYFTPQITAHLGGAPYRKFKPGQKDFETLHSVGYREFMRANEEVDRCFITLIQRLVKGKGTPLLIAIAGQTAAGKTEITARLQEVFTASGQQITTLEIDHFFKDRDYREARGIDSLGKEALHYEIFKNCLLDIRAGKKITSPRYDFVQATSSHDPQGQLRPGCRTIEIQPADIIFMEGNFPFLLPEIAPLIGVKVMYLTDDAVRIKRKWKRDMDYRKKYELYYFLNRYFREQFLMAHEAYIPQMGMCDVLVDTTAAEIWVAPPIRAMLSSQEVK